MRSILTGAAFLAVISLPAWGLFLADGTEGRFVSDDVLREALASERPTRLPGADELEFYRQRRAQRGEDPLADRRIVSAHLQRFQAYGAAEDLAAAAALNDSLLLRRPTDPSLWSTKTQIHLSRHEFREARDGALKAIAHVAPEERDDARLRLFDAFFAVGQYDEAERILELPSRRTAFSYLVRSARLADRKGDVTRARDLMREALHLAEAYAQPSTLLAWNHVELGHFEYHSGSPAAAVQHYRRALAVAPGYPAALEGLAWVAFGTDENADAAKALFTRALETGGHQDLRLALAEVARFEGNDAEATRQIAQLAELSAMDEGARRLFALPLALALSETDPRIARSLSEENLAGRATAESLAVHGWVLHRLGEKEKASALFQEALSWGTPQPLVFYLAGKHAAEAGDQRAARPLLAAALEGGAELGPHRSREIRKHLGRM